MGEGIGKSVTGLSSLSWTSNVPLKRGRIGVVDTTFSEIDTGSLAVQRLKDMGVSDIVRRTVPGIKDLPVGAQRLFLEEGCELVMALGMPGDAEIDRECANQASLGLQWAMLSVGRHIVEVFVHKVEGEGSQKKLKRLLKQRTLDHCQSAHDLVFSPEALVKRAGQGMRQGHESIGPLE